MKKAFILLILTQNLIAQEPKEFFVEKSIPVKEVTDLGGFFGDRIRKNKDVYLKQFPIQNYIDFVKRQDHTDWDWTQASPPKGWNPDVAYK